MTFFRLFHAALVCSLSLSAFQVLTIGGEGQSALRIEMRDATSLVALENDTFSPSLRSAFEKEVAAYSI